MYISGFRTCQHLRSLAPVMNDDDGQMIFGDLVGLKLPDICLTGEEKPRKTSPRKLVLTGDRTRARCMTSAHATTCSTAVDFRVPVTDPFFITCDNSPYTSIIYEITDKLTTDIHSTSSLLGCQFMRYRSTADVRFSKCPNLAMYGNF